MMFWEEDRRKSRNDCDVIGETSFSVSLLLSSSSEATQWALRVEIVLLCFISLSRWLSFASSLATAAECSACFLSTTSRLDFSFLCAQLSNSREMSTQEWPHWMYAAHFKEFFGGFITTIQMILKKRQWLQRMKDKLSWIKMCLNRARWLMNFCFIVSLHIWQTVQKYTLTYIDIETSA